MLCDDGVRLDGIFATATQALGEYADFNKGLPKDTVYEGQHHALERVWLEAMRAFNAHRDNCPTCETKNE